MTTALATSPEPRGFLDASVEACHVFGDSLAVYRHASSLSLRLHLGRGHFGILHLILYSEPRNALECLVQDSELLEKKDVSGTFRYHLLA